MVIDVDTTFTRDAPRATNFFNGRLLSGEDLTRERSAGRQLLERLGRACGEGIAYGLEVKLAEVKDDPRPCLKVSPGLAINRLGATLELLGEVTVALLPAASVARTAGAGAKATSTATSAGEFGRCQALAGSYLATRGVYLLVLRPATAREGSAPASGLGDIDSACTAASLVDGVAFHLERLEEPELPAGVLADEARLRNRVAHLCFGSGDERRGSWVRDPFGARSETWGLLDQLRGRKLQDCDVPLAVFYWKEGAPGAAGHVEWVDLWSVRRRPARVAFGGPLTPAVAERRQVEGEAMILQFQEQLAAIAGGRETLRATSVARWLPPVGALPLADGAAAGFDVLRFFDGLTLRGPVHVEGAGLAALTRQAAAYEPVDVESRELISLYLVRENLQAEHGVRFLVFVSGHVPFADGARFDRSRWGYADFAPDWTGGAGTPE